MCGFCLTEWIPPKDSQGILWSETLLSWSKNDRDSTKCKESFGTPHTLKPLWAGNRLRKLLSCKHWIHFIEKNNSEGKTQSCGEWFLGSRADHRTGNMFLVGLQNCFGPVTTVFLTFFFLFEEECGYLTPVHYCILGLGGRRECPSLVYRSLKGKQWSSRSYTQGPHPNSLICTWIWFRWQALDPKPEADAALDKPLGDLSMFCK